jgi:hypothetical protein
LLQEIENYGADLLSSAVTFIPVLVKISRVDQTFKQERVQTDTNTDSMVISRYCCFFFPLQEESLEDFIVNNIKSARVVFQAIDWPYFSHRSSRS